MPLRADTTSSKADCKSRLLNRSRTETGIADEIAIGANHKVVKIFHIQSENIH